MELLTLRCFDLVETEISTFVTDVKVESNRPAGSKMFCWSEDLQQSPQCSP